MNYVKEKTKKIKKVFKNFPFCLIFSGFVLLSLMIIYSILTFRNHNIEIYFLEKLINFNTPNFDIFLKKLEELKKKFRNDNNEEEDEDKEDIEDSDSKKNSKKDEEDENKE